jgi:hypothetical protein
MSPPSEAEPPGLSCSRDQPTTIGLNTAGVFRILREDDLGSRRAADSDAHRKDGSISPSVMADAQPTFRIVLYVVVGVGMIGAGGSTRFSGPSRPFG